MAMNETEWLKLETSLMEAIEKWMAGLDTDDLQFMPAGLERRMAQAAMLVMRANDEGQTGAVESGALAEAE